MIVSVVSQKGGVGKTTIAVHLAAGLAAAGRQALLVDLDPQGHAGLALGVAPGGGVFDWLVGGRPLPGLVRATGREGLHVLRSDKETGLVGPVLQMRHGGAVGRDLLGGALGPAMRNGLEVAVLDTAPTVSVLQSLALAVSDVVVVPVACDWLSLQGFASTLDSLDAVEAERQVVVVPTFYESRPLHCSEVLGELRRWSSGVLPPVHRATVIRDAGKSGATVWEYAPATRAAEELRRVLSVVAGAMP